MKLRGVAVALVVVSVGLGVSGIGRADDDEPVYGDPGQKLAPPPVKREPRLKVDLVKSPKVEMADDRAKLLELRDKMTNRSIGYQERTALAKEYATTADHLKGLMAAQVQAEAEEVARGIADEKAEKEAERKVKLAKREAEAKEKREDEAKVRRPTSSNGGESAGDDDQSAGDASKPSAAAGQTAPSAAATSSTAPASPDNSPASTSTPSPASTSASTPSPTSTSSDSSSADARPQTSRVPPPPPNADADN